jgi:hypothetical protein
LCFEKGGRKTLEKQFSGDLGNSNFKIFPWACQPWCRLVDNNPRKLCSRIKFFQTSQVWAMSLIKERYLVSRHNQFSYLNNLIYISNSLHIEISQLYSVTWMFSVIHYNVWMGCMGNVHRYYIWGLRFTH